MNSSPARPVLVLLEHGAPWLIPGDLPPRHALAALREVGRLEAAYAPVLERRRVFPNILRRA